MAVFRGGKEITAKTHVGANILDGRVDYLVSCRSTQQCSLDFGQTSGRPCCSRDRKTYAADPIVSPRYHGGYTTDRVQPGGMLESDVCRARSLRQRRDGNGKDDFTSLDVRTGRPFEKVLRGNHS